MKLKRRDFLKTSAMAGFGLMTFNPLLSAFSKGTGTRSLFMTNPIELSGIPARIQYLQLITALLCEPEEDVTHNPDLYNQLKQCIMFLNPDMISMVEELHQSSVQEISALLIEYSRLFIGPFKLPAPPYASCYLGSKEFNNEVTEWIRHFYESAGLEFDYTIMDMPDHIAVETEFLNYLITAAGFLL